MCADAERRVWKATVITMIMIILMTTTMIITTITAITTTAITCISVRDRRALRCPVCLKSA